MLGDGSKLFYKYEADFEEVYDVYVSKIWKVSNATGSPIPVPRNSIRVSSCL